MTLTKVRWSGKKEGSLRPLTEKEIQKKLYGAYGEPRLGEEETKPSWTAESLRKDRQQAPVATVEKKPIKPFTIKIPWEKVMTGLSIGARTLVEVSKALISKIGTGWGVTLVAAALLLFGIHSLNAFRSDAMKKAKPAKATAIESFRKQQQLAAVKGRPERSQPPRVAEDVSTPAPPLKSHPQEGAIPPLIPISPAVNVTKTPPPSPLEPQHPYVIQVCTYANEEDADRLATRLEASDLPAFVHALKRANGKIFYLVLLGRYASYGESQTRLKAFRNHPISKDFSDSFIREL